ncbi:hypothetical protein BIU90_02860 [Curtobacterium sp. MCBA15_001]|nr:hypothetical protein BIU90_02860 [Curtobacterium sp. MCBA15_001]
MSQRALADAMTERGWKWSHVTVGSVERGDRPLRAAEAIGVAEILEVEVVDLVNAREASQMREATQKLLAQYHRLRHAVSDWDLVRREYAQLADSLGREVDNEVIARLWFPAEEVVANEHRMFGLDEYPWATENGPWMKLYIESERAARGQHPAAS